MSINGYTLDEWGLTYKVYLPRDPRYTRKDRPAHFVHLTEGLKDSMQNRYVYCFYTHIDREDDTIRFDYDGKDVEDPTSFYNLLSTKLQPNAYISPVDAQRFADAGMLSIDGTITLRIPNCWVEIVEDGDTDNRLNALEELTEEELLRIAQQTLAKQSGTDGVKALRMPKDKEEARRKLLTFIRDNNVAMRIGAGTGKHREVILPQNHIYLYDPTREPGANFEEPFILKSAEGIYYLIQLQRKVSLKVLSGLRTLAKRSMRDYPNLPTEPKTSTLVKEWLEAAQLKQLMEEDILPQGMIGVRLGDKLELVEIE